MAGGPARPVLTTVLAMVLAAVLLGTTPAGAVAGSRGVTARGVTVPATSTLYVGESFGTNQAPATAEPGGIGVFDPADLAKGASTVLPPPPTSGGTGGVSSAVLVGTTLVGLDSAGRVLRRYNTLTGSSTDQPLGGPQPMGPVFRLVASPDGAVLYLVGTDNGSLQVTAMDTFTWTVTTTFDVPGTGPSASTTSFPTVDPGTGDLWIPQDSGVVVVDPSTWTSQVLLAGTATGQVAFNGGNAWVPAGPSLIDLATSDLATVRSVESPYGVGTFGSAAASPGGADVYATLVLGVGPDWEIFAWTISATTGALILSNTVGTLGPEETTSPAPLVVSADGSTVFIATNVNSAYVQGSTAIISTLDTATDTLTGDTADLGPGGGGNSYLQLVTALVPVPTSPYPTQGYWQVATDGGVFSFGNAAFHGSMGGTPLNQPIVGLTAGPGDQGYWEVASDGGIFAFGSAPFYGSMGGTPLNRPVVGIASTPDRKGYWEVASDGGIFAFGDAAFYGSMGGRPLNQPIVGIAATPDGGGYLEVAADGGIFAFGDAAFHGSMGGQPLNRPVVGIATDPSTGGYWMVADDGGIFAFDAPFQGSPVGTGLAVPVLGMAATADGSGYWVLGAGGALDGFGDAGNYGSMGGTPLNQPMVGMGATGATA